MKQGHLSTYFRGIAAKRLSAVEALLQRSHQHEFNGVTQLKEILGTERHKFPARFIYLGEDEEDYTVDTGNITWYDAREAHPTRSEYRLYYPTTSVSELAAEGDLLVIGRLPDDSALVIIAQAGTRFERNIVWLFDLTGENMTIFAVRDIESGDDTVLDFASRLILEEIGIESVETDEDYLDAMIGRFGAGFPPTSVFSAYARQTLPEVSALANPDEALIAWMEQEEILFRTMERHIVGKRLRTGFDDVDIFISYSLSVQNRRKSRAGQALENHLEQVFIDTAVRYSRGGETENRAKPDFIFPSVEAYHDPGFLPGSLTMLGVKSTCKDRWRQVLSEAARINDKHLLTLEPGISENQTSEMQANRLQLVLPRNLHKTYSARQTAWLMDIAGFINLVKRRQ